MITKYRPSDYEVLRRCCFELKQVGWKQKDITVVLGLTAGCVSQTLKKYREKGLEGLLTRKPTGCPPKLGPDQLSQLAAALNLGAVNHGFPNHIWMRARVNEVIVKKFGASYDLTQVGQLLKKLGWSVSIPIVRTIVNWKNSPHRSFIMNFMINRT